MPLTEKGSKIMSAMREQYGKKKGTSVFYASKNKGNISGVDNATHDDQDPPYQAMLEACMKKLGFTGPPNAKETKDALDNFMRRAANDGKFMVPPSDQSPVRIGYDDRSQQDDVVGAESWVNGHKTGYSISGGDALPGAPRQPVGAAQPPDPARTNPAANQLSQAAKAHGAAARAHTKQAEVHTQAASRFSGTPTARMPHGNIVSGVKPPQPKQTLTNPAPKPKITGPRIVSAQSPQQIARAKAKAPMDRAAAFDAFRRSVDQRRRTRDVELTTPSAAPESRPASAGPELSTPSAAPEMSTPSEGSGHSFDRRRRARDEGLKPQEILAQFLGKTFGVKDEERGMQPRNPDPKEKTDNKTLGAVWDAETCMPKDAPGMRPDGEGSQFGTMISGATTKKFRAEAKDALRRGMPVRDAFRHALDAAMPKTARSVLDGYMRRRRK